MIHNQWSLFTHGLISHWPVCSLGAQETHSRVFLSPGSSSAATRTLAVVPQQMDLRDGEGVDDLMITWVNEITSSLRANPGNHSFLIGKSSPFMAFYLIQVSELLFHLPRWLVKRVKLGGFQDFFHHVLDDHNSTVLILLFLCSLKLENATEGFRTLKILKGSLWGNRKTYKVSNSKKCGAWKSEQLISTSYFKDVMNRHGSDLESGGHRGWTRSTLRDPSVWRCSFFNNDLLWLLLTLSTSIWMYLIDNTRSY